MLKKTTKKSPLFLSIFFFFLFFFSFVFSSFFPLRAKERVYRIGILQYVEHPSLNAAREGFLEALAEGGLRVGENLQIDERNAQAEAANAQTIARQFESLHEDLVLAIATPAAQAAAQILQETPLLFTAVTDPVEAGLVQNLGRPEKNVSGTIDAAPIEAQLRFLQRLVPSVKRLAILYTAGEVNSVLQAEQVETIAAKLGLQTEQISVSASNEIQQATASAAGRFDALYIPTDNNFASAMATVAGAVIPERCPVIASSVDQVRDGGLATVGLDYRSLGRLTGKQALGLLLEGKSVAETPVEQLTETRPVINVEMARKIGVEIPDDPSIEHLQEEGLQTAASPAREEREVPTLRSRLPRLLAGAALQGLIWGILAIGVYITFRLLNFPDLTVDGSLATGGLVAAVLLHAGFSPWLALGMATLAGLLAGALTGFLHTKMKIPGILASILTQLALYSINLRIAGGKPNVSLLGLETVFSPLERLLKQPLAAGLLLSLLLTILLIALMYWFFGTEIGIMIRATGNNPKVVRAVGVNTDLTLLLGLAISNAFVALSGGVLAQQQGFADVGMGQGAIVTGLAAIIIGEVLFAHGNFAAKLAAIFVGSVIYRMVFAFVIELGMRASDMKMLTAALVAIALYLPVLHQHHKDKKNRRKNHAAH